MSYRLTSLLCAVWITAGLPALAEDPPRCEGDPTIGWGFARVSPLQPSLDAKGRQKTDRIVVRFADAFPVLERQGPHYRMCIEDQALWFSGADVSFTSQKRLIVTTAGMSETDRPRLEYWRSLERLSIYLGRSRDDDAGPIYQEVPVGQVARDARMPLLREEAVYTDVGNRVIEVANVLMPIRRDAVDAYARIRAADADAETAGAIALLLDISGSTEGFVSPAVVSLQDALRSDAADGPDMPVIVAAFGGDGSSDVRRYKNANDAGMTDWSSRPAPGIQVGRHDVAGSIEMLASDPAGPETLVVMAGGDISLGRANLAGFANVIAAQITPERQVNLAESARAAGAAYLDFADLDASRLADLLKDLKDGGPLLVTDARAFGELAEIAAVSGNIALLPKDIAGSAQLAAIPPGREDYDWFAVPLWTVLRKDLLEIVEE